MGLLLFIGFIFMLASGKVPLSTFSTGLILVVVGIVQFLFWLDELFWKSAKRYEEKRRKQ